MDSAGSKIVRLRPWVEIRRLGPQEFLLLDRVSGRRLEVGAEERFLLHQLTHSEGLEEVESAFEKKFRRRLERRHLQDFIGQLSHLGLADCGLDEPPPEVVESPALTAGDPPTPLSNRDAAAALNSRFDLLTLLFGWILHPIWAAVISLLWIWAVSILVRDWDRILSEVRRIVAECPNGVILFLSLLQTLLFVNLPRALLTGMTCRRFGGRLQDFGLRVSEDLPLLTFYCEHGDSFAHMDERGKNTWLAADMWAQLAIGAVAVFGWSFFGPRHGMGLFCIFLIPPTLIGVLVNINIFLPYRGYWLLCYTVDDPQLRERALGETLAWLAWGPSPEPLTASERYWLRVYGLGYYLFRLVLEPLAFLGLGAWLTYRFQGTGALILTGSVFWHHRKPIEEFFMGIAVVRWAIRCGGRPWVRWTARLFLASGVAALGFLPYTYEIVGECRLLPAAQRGVRVHINDEIDQILISEGQLVEAGEVIARLKGVDVIADVKQTAAELQKAQAQLDLLHHGPRPQDVNIAQARVEIRKSQLELLVAQTSRVEALQRKGAASFSEIDKLRHDRDEAKLNLLSAREQLSQLEVGYRPESIASAEAEVLRLKEKLQHDQQRLEFIEITSPIRGRVTLPYMEQRPGQATRPGDLITVLHDDSHLEAEVAADDAAAIQVVPGMRVKIRLYGTYGSLMNGRVRCQAPAAEAASTFGNSPVRTDSESYQEQMLNSRYHSSGHHVRVYVDIEDPPRGLKAEMSGYARIIVRNDVLWRAIARPIVRFLRTEVWSWLP